MASLTCRAIETNASIGPSPALRVLQCAPIVPLKSKNRSFLPYVHFTSLDNQGDSNRANHVSTPREVDDHRCFFQPCVKSFPHALRLWWRVPIHFIMENASKALWVYLMEWMAPTPISWLIIEIWSIGCWVSNSGLWPWILFFDSRPTTCSYAFIMPYSRLCYIFFRLPSPRAGQISNCYIYYSHRRSICSWSYFKSWC